MSGALRFFFRRVAVSILTLLGVSILVFMMMQLLPPGMRAAVWIPAGPISSEQFGETVGAYGQQETLPFRYLLWMKSVLKGEFGYSAAAGAPVSRAFGEYLLPSLPVLSVIFLAAAFSPFPDRRFRGSGLFGSLTGLMLVGENFFGLEGIGWWLREALIRLDTAAVIFIVLFTSLLSAAAELAADLAGGAMRKAEGLQKLNRHLEPRAARAASAAGAAIVLLFALTALFAPLLAPSANPDMPYRIASGGQLQGIVWGARSAFKMVVPAVMGTLLIGGTMGVLSPRAGGKAGGPGAGIAGIERVLRTVPMLVLAAALVFALGGGLASIVIALIILDWPAYAEQVRRSRKEEKPFTDLAAFAASRAGNTLLAASSLSFLGLGAGPAYAEWGQMAASLREDAFLPLLAIALLVLGWKLAGIRGWRK